MSISNDQVAVWCAYLRSHGWRPYQRKPGYEKITLWISPQGGIYRGPFGAYLAAKAIEESGE